MGKPGQDHGETCLAGNVGVIPLTFLNAGGRPSPPPQIPDSRLPGAVGGGLSSLSNLLIGEIFRKDNCCCDLTFNEGLLEWQRFRSKTTNAVLPSPACRGGGEKTAVKR
jgi:hypothetical protein